MRNYYYCEGCNELIHKDNLSILDGEEVCPDCKDDLIHTEDIEEGDELWNNIQELELKKEQEKK